MRARPDGRTPIGRAATRGHAHRREHQKRRGKRPHNQMRRERRVRRRRALYGNSWLELRKRGWREAAKESRRERMQGRSTVKSFQAWIGKDERKRKGLFGKNGATIEPAGNQPTRQRGSNASAEGKLEGKENERGIDEWKGRENMYLAWNTYKKTFRREKWGSRITARLYKPLVALF